jgi:signal transduction histidine kinase
MRAGEIRGRTAFIGVTALDAARDRIVNPYGVNLPGVEEHVHAFETLARGDFLTPAKEGTLLLVCGLLAVAAGLIFAFLSGYAAYAAGAALIGVAMYLPIILFNRGIVLPYSSPVLVAWLCSLGAATYQHFFVRRQLAVSESEKSRYQQAIHWAAHEMRTPLTAIQGSSEIMAKYNLPEAKQHQLSEMINSESKRLSRIIQTFLDVERLADGQMELKREPFSAASILETCFQRALPLAERKRISISLDAQTDATITGDRELMEYALYNLMTNAVKYSPAQTQVSVSSSNGSGEVRLAVRDQGIGMDAKEQKKVFQKFYRTKSAEASGEVGTGIGLSIVEQIVKHHGGRIELTSAPGEGSCFTIVLKAS